MALTLVHRGGKMAFANFSWPTFGSLKVNPYQVAAPVSFDPTDWVQNLLISKHKSRTRKTPGPAFMFGSGGAIRPLASAAQRLAVLEIRLLAA